MSALGNPSKTVVLIGCALWLSGTSAAQNANHTDSGPTKEVTDDSAASGAEQYLLRTVKFSGSIRERLEATDGDFSVTPNAAYLLSQVRLGMTFQPATWLTFFAQAQDARVMFYETKPASGLSNPFDLRQAWLAVGQREGPGVFLQLGRQEMVIGSGHLLASTDAWWANTARTFDVARGTFTTSWFKTELLGGSAVLMDPNRMDRNAPGDHIYAAYNTISHVLPGGSLEPYFFARTLVGVRGKDGQLGNMDTLAVGGRVIGTLPKGLDYSFEALHEYGSYANDRLDASGMIVGGGWTMAKSAWKPRFSGDLTYASGDDGRKNGYRETFDNMYGYNQPMNSLTGLFGWRNIKDLRSGVEFFPVKKLKLKVDYRDYWLSSTADGLYNAAGARTVYNPKATNAHIGEGVEMLATATITRTTTVGFGVGTLFAGEYLKQSNKSSNFFYPLVYVYQRF